MLNQVQTTRIWQTNRARGCAAASSAALDSGGHSTRNPSSQAAWITPYRERSGSGRAYRTGFMRQTSPCHRGRFMLLPGCIPAHDDRLMMRQSWLTVASILSGIGVWAVISAVSGRNEAWDSSWFCAAGYPLICAGSMALGFVAPVWSWRRGIDSLRGSGQRGFWNQAGGKQ